MKSTLLSILLLPTGLLMAQTVNDLPRTIQAESRFFHTDTAYIQGRIREGATPLCKESGLVLIHNEIIDKSTPTVIKIHPDGTFQCKFVINYPIESRINLSNDVIPFYIEPGDTLNVLLDRTRINTNNHIQYTGPSAHICELLNTTNNLLSHNAKTITDARTLSPDQFKEQVQPLFQLWEGQIDSLIAINGYSGKVVRLLKNKLSLKKGCTLLDFLSIREYYATRDTTNNILQIKENISYYDFLKKMPLDDETVLSTQEFRTFINRFEYMQLLREEGQNQTSLINRLCGVPNPFVWQIAGIRHLNNTLKSVEDSNMALDSFVRLKQSLRHPLLLAEAERIFSNRQAEIKNASYELSAGYGTNIFRRIIRPHQGKVLFIDFWGTSCGGCRLGIEQTAGLRKKYKDHPEFQFIYITSEDSSPIRAYTKYIETNLSGESSYRVSRAEFNYLMELFHFSGMPHYELIEKDGSVSTKEINTSNLASYLEKRFN